MTGSSAQAVFGGTFNPIHNGHLRSAQALLERLPIDHLRFVPAHVPPHRDEPSVSALHRAEMVELALAGDSRLSCDRRELEREGPSYTVDTLASLRADLDADTPIALVMGCDAFLGFESWYRWASILELAHLAVMARPGWSLPEAGTLAALVEERRGDAADVALAPAGRIVTIELEPWDVSSTQIRALLQSGTDVTDLMPGAALDYARAHRLYE